MTQPHEVRFAPEPDDNDRPIVFPPGHELHQEAPPEMPYSGTYPTTTPLLSRDGERIAAWGGSVVYDRTVRDLHDLPDLAAIIMRRRLELSRRPGWSIAKAAELSLSELHAVYFDIPEDPMHMQDDA